MAAVVIVVRYRQTAGRLRWWIGERTGRRPTDWVGVRTSEPAAARFVTERESHPKAQGFCVTVHRDEAPPAVVA